MYIVYIYNYYLKQLAVNLHYYTLRFVRGSPGKPEDKSLVYHDLPCQVEGADLPVRIHPNHHPALGTLLLQETGIRHNHGLRGLLRQLEHGEGHDDWVVMHSQGDWVTLMGRMYRDLITPEANIRPPGVTQRSEASNTRCVCEVTTVIEDLDIKSYGPDLLL